MPLTYIRKNIAALLLVLGCAWGLPSLCFGEGAGVLPKGVGTFTPTYYHYFDITERFDPNGKKEDLAVNFNGELDSTVFPLLAPLDNFVPGNASIGELDTKFTLRYRWFDNDLLYGVTDKLTFKVSIPISYSENRVKAKLRSKSANVGKNAAFACGQPICPLGVPGTVPLSDEDAQDLIGGGIDVNGDGNVDIPGFGYERFESWKQWGINDISATAKFQYFNNKAWLHAITGGFRAPTGRINNPNSLTALGFGDHTWDLLFRHHTTYLGIENLNLNILLSYDVQLPDKTRRRVISDANEPITANTEKVRRNLGDIFGTEVGVGYAFTPEWGLGARYVYNHKFRDSVDGDKGFNYSALEDETAWQSHMIIGALTFSTVNLYFDKKFPLPFDFTVAYRNRLYGTNNVTVSEYVSFALTLYFKVPYFANNNEKEIEKENDEPDATAWIKYPALSGESELEKRKEGEIFVQRY